MPRSVDTAFASFDNNLNLDPKERLKAQLRHNDIRDELSSAGLIEASFLQGSFARKTMLKPLKDVDIVCLLPESMRAELHTPDGPAQAMEMFKEPIVARWPSVMFDYGDEPSGKALRLTFEDCTFTVDLVPAFVHIDDHVLIGDRHERTWEPSNTRIQLDRVSSRNQKTDGRFVHQVRELKAMVKNESDLEFVKGIVVESLAYAALTGKLLDKHAMHLVIRHAATAVLKPVIEPAGEDDVTAKWSQAERHVAAGVFRDSANRARVALDLEREGDVTGAIDAWHALMGDGFPAAPDRSPAQVMEAWAGGTMTRDGRPSSTHAAPQQMRPGRGWSPWPSR